MESNQLCAFIMGRLAGGALPYVGPSLDSTTMSTPSIVRTTDWILREQFGLDARKTVRGIMGLPRYVRDLILFRRDFEGPLRLKPCMHDWTDAAGATASEYFWQDLRVARLVFEHSPRRHLDVGSRLDGFVAHVASYREIEVVDVRPLRRPIPGVGFIQLDVSDRAAVESFRHSIPPSKQVDSLSCLHAIEHFGLGRYGDPVMPNAYAVGISNMSGLIADGGRLYLSTPIGRGRVEFNANRVFDPVILAADCAQFGLRLEWGEIFDPLTGSVNVIHQQAELVKFADIEYQLALFVFSKTTGAGISSPTKPAVG